jgi:hypothetical protein
VLVDSVFHYRTLQGKCDLGIGLDWDEIEQLTHIEHAFAPSADDRRSSSGRKFRREAVKLVGLMRGNRIHDRVDIVELAPGGLVVSNAPFVARGEAVEIVIESGDVSYRFRAEGVWIRDDGDDFKLGLVFRGMPVRVHKKPAVTGRDTVRDLAAQIAA